MKTQQNTIDYREMDSKELFKLYSENRGNKEIRDILIERYLYLVELLSKKYINKGVEFDDIYQVGSLALMYAIDRYDIEKGYEFSSFATPTIIGEIKKYFRDKAWTLRVPRRVQEFSKKVNDAKLVLEQQYKRHPKVNEIAQYLECSQEEVLEAMEASYGYKPVSLDVSNNDDGEDKDLSLIDKIGAEESDFKRIEESDFFSRLFKKLNELEIKIIQDRFYKEKTQAEIAKELDISQMTISRLEKKVIEKIKKEYKKSL